MNHSRRLRDLEVVWRRPDPYVGLHVTLCDGWPPDAVDAYHLARSIGNHEQAAALIRAHDGVEIGPRTQVIVMTDRPDGPQ